MKRGTYYSLSDIYSLIFQKLHQSWVLRCLTTMRKLPTLLKQSSLTSTLIPRTSAKSEFLLCFSRPSSSYHFLFFRLLFKSDFTPQLMKNILESCFSKATSWVTTSQSEGMEIQLNSFFWQRSASRSSRSHSPSLIHGPAQSVSQQALSGSFCPEGSFMSKQ